jgi:hypothetical protein
MSLVIIVEHFERNVYVALVPDVLVETPHQGLVRIDAHVDLLLRAQVSGGASSGPSGAREWLRR